MEITRAGKRGRGALFMDPDVDAWRAHSRTRSRRLESKLTTVKDAIAGIVADGDYLGVGGFGTNRIPTALLHELVRQGRRNLGVAGHTSTHDFQILAAGACIDRCDVAYVVGLEARGLSKAARRLFETGALEVTEWTNAALAWRYRAAAMGIPFIPARVMLGTDTFERSAAIEIECPYTGIPLVALPALSPDVALIHVHRADAYGNCQIDGITVADEELARASKRVIVTCERLVPTEQIRANPDRTRIPWYLVDAVIEVPYGSYPGNMAGEYFSDEDHLRAWMAADVDEVSIDAFVDRYIRETKNFCEYLELCGGVERLAALRAEELLSIPAKDGERR
jgi:glutaconate CoA-transferase, subunit A